MRSAHHALFQAGMFFVALARVLCSETSAHALVIGLPVRYAPPDTTGMLMTRLTSFLLASVFLLAVSLAAPAVAQQPDPITLAEITVKISDGNGGRDILRVIPMVQPRRSADVKKILARSGAIAQVLRDRLRTVTSAQLIPPDGSSEWLEREFWDLAEKILKPTRLDGALFRELSIE